MSDILLNEDLIDYLSNVILPLYGKLDKGHDSKHIMAVVNNTKNICNEINYEGNINIPITAAFYHDIGLTVDRKLHHEFSAQFVLDDDKLNEYFTKDEIKIISTAVSEHRTSSDKSILESKILYDADKLDSALDIKRMLERSIFFNRYKGNNKCFTDVYEHLKQKYGNGGTVEYAIIEETPEMKSIKDILEDREACKIIYTDIIKQLDN